MGSLLTVSEKWMHLLVLLISLFNQSRNLIPSSPNTRQDTSLEDRERSVEVGCAGPFVWLSHKRRETRAPQNFCASPTPTNEPEKKKKKKKKQWRWIGLPPPDSDRATH